MQLLHVNTEKDAELLNELIKKTNHVFVLIYMEGCGPCNATRPEWSKMNEGLKSQYSKHNDLVIADVNKNVVSKIDVIGSINGYPTMKYFGNRGKKVENYEDSSINKKDRSSNSFINWVESKIINVVSTDSVENVYNRISKSITPKKRRGVRKTHRKRKFKRSNRHRKKPKTRKFRTKR